MFERHFTSEIKAKASLIKNTLFSLPPEIDRQVFTAIGQNKNKPVLAAEQFANFCIDAYCQGKLAFPELYRRIITTDNQLSAANQAHHKHGVATVLDKNAVTKGKKQIVDTSLRMILAGLNINYDLNAGRRKYVPSFILFDEYFEHSRVTPTVVGNRCAVDNEKWSRIEYLGRLTHFIPMKYYLLLVLEDVLQFEEARYAALTLGSNGIVADAERNIFSSEIG